MKYIRNKELSTKKIGKTWYILEPNHKAMRQLNAVASTLWAALDRPLTLTALVNKVCREFKVERGQATRDLEKFLSQYLKEGYLRRV